jgi:hypothetical protein
VVEIAAFVNFSVLAYYMLNIFKLNVFNSIFFYKSELISHIIFKFALFSLKKISFNLAP